MDLKIPLIVGAGPVGLAAALFLAHRGIQTRIIDAAPKPSPYSKALAVNPRTLEILEPLGVTDEMLAHGLKFTEVNFWRDNRKLGRIGLETLPHRFQFMLSLSQASTEKILTKALEKFGIPVERGISLSTCQIENGKIAVHIGGQIARPAWMLGADGAHSVVRHSLGIGFPGSAYEQPWYLADVALDTNLPQHAPQAFFTKGGFIALIRVVEDIRTETVPIWRVISNFPDPLNRLFQAKPAAKPVWQSQFRVSHRMAERMNVGPVYLAGDAAHIHSPIGARGMNLGIEDAYVFSELMTQGRIREYGPLRHAVDSKVVRNIKTASFAASRNGPIALPLKTFLLPRLTQTEFFLKSALPVVTGLDHPL